MKIQCSFKTKYGKEVEPLFKPLTQLNYFFQLATERELIGSDQLLYLHIFNKFNQAHWQESLRIKDAELKELMRLFDTSGKPASLETIRRGKQRLKAKGFIDFKSGAGGQPTEYRLIKFYPDDTPSYTPDNTPADVGSVSYTHVREDVKRIKEKREEGACVRESEGVKAINPTTEDDIFKVWSENAMPYLGAEQKYELLGYVEDENYGFEKVKAAILAVRDKRQFPTFADFRKELTAKGNPKPQDSTKTTRKATRQNNAVADVLKTLD